MSSEFQKELFTLKNFKRQSSQEDNLQWRMRYTQIFQFSSPLLWCMDSSQQGTLCRPCSSDFVIHLRLFFPKGLDFNEWIQEMPYLSRESGRHQFSSLILPFSLPYRHVTFFSGVQWIRWTHIDYWNVLQCIPNKTVLKGELGMEVCGRIVRRAVK